MSTKADAGPTLLDLFLEAKPAVNVPFHREGRTPSRHGFHVRETWVEGKGRRARFTARLRFPLIRPFGLADGLQFSVDLAAAQGVCFDAQHVEVDGYVLVSGLGEETQHGRQFAAQPIEEIGEVAESMAGGF